MGGRIELVATLAELQRLIHEMDGLLAKAEALTAQLESGQKSAAVVPTILAHIESARRLAALVGGSTP
jgi:hypothetical protein